MRITRTQRLDYEFSVTQAGATDVSTERVAGLRRPGLVGVRILAINTDKGASTGAVITTASFVAKPDAHSGDMGGGRAHTFACIDSYAQNSVSFGVILDPGEDLVLELTNGTAGRTLRYRVMRELLFDDSLVTPPPADAAA